MIGGLPTAPPGTPTNNLPGQTRASPGRRRSSLLAGMATANPAARRHSTVGARGDVAVGGGGGGGGNALELKIGPGNGAQNWNKVKASLKSGPLGALSELMKLREGRTEENMDAGGDRQRRRHSSIQGHVGQDLRRVASVTFNGVPPVFDAMKVSRGGARLRASPQPSFIPPPSLLSKNLSLSLSHAYAYANTNTHAARQEATVLGRPTCVTRDRDGSRE